MTTILTFLRGVNMTGHNTVKMTELSSLYKDLGFNDAETYIQSGNVIFSNFSNIKESEIASKIELAIHKRFGYEVPVMVRTIGEMQKLMSFNPYLKEVSFDSAKMAIIFLHEEPSSEQIDKVKDIHYPPDKFLISGREIYIYCPNGFGRTKLYTNFFEKKMGVTGTARNWKTITAMFNIAEKR